MCIRSHYKLEGKLPIGVALANKLRDSEKKISDSIDFESELRILSTADLDQDGLQKLTGVSTPVAGVLEQNMFHVNQVMRFGKLVAVFQPNPADAKSTIATVMIALAVSSSTLEMKKKYQAVPVLRIWCRRRCCSATARSTPAIRSAPACRAMCATASRRLPEFWTAAERRPHAEFKRPASAGRFVLARPRHRFNLFGADADALSLPAREGSASIERSEMRDGVRNRCEESPPGAP